MIITNEQIEDTLEIVESIFETEMDKFQFSVDGKNCIPKGGSELRRLKINQALVLLDISVDFSDKTIGKEEDWKEYVRKKARIKMNKQQINLPKRKEFKKTIIKDLMKVGLVVFGIIIVLLLLV